ncbi:AAA family ATPase [Microcystis sp.]|uniref:AAA family ATPase n=2 Tax=Microcystis sp. TaxID=1127 RepID=UPI00391D446E
MRLLRVQVPDFRVLKNIDLSFEKDFFPQIFPIGSQNGGGKSTLLQLIFILLHCSGDPQKIEYVVNVLNRCQLEDELDQKTLAIFEILTDNREEVKLDFFICRDAYVKQFVSDIDGQFVYDFGDVYIKQFVSDIDGLFLYLCRAKNQKNEEIFLLCKFSQSTQEEFQLLMKELSSKIFLAAPSTQVFIFLPKATNKSLFQINQGNPDSSNYYLAMADIKKKLSNLFTYDFLPVELLINYFIMARDQDFAQAIETGEYGNNYQLRRQNLNSILSDKEINLDKDISGITFKFKGDTNGEELYPEDLSHGELKRLSIYLWLKYRRIKDAIVLMDEIEIALHPDWQYKIIEDLQEWEPSNQYILATHSYELCQALTPAHVKEIEPKLLK